MARWASSTSSDSSTALLRSVDFSRQRRWWVRTGAGFTIVELLIVVVVIAILAAITIVAYNGVAQRATASAASSAAEQAAKKVLVYMTTNSDQAPPDLATSGVLPSGTTSFQYTPNASSSPQSFCVTATANNVSYFVNNTNQTTPAAGACPGHGLNGAPAITNLAMNPSFEANLNGWSTTWPSGQAALARVTTGIGITNGSAALEQTVGTSSAMGCQFTMSNLQLSAQYVMSADLTLVSGDPATLQFNVSDGGGSRAWGPAIGTLLSAGQTKRFSMAWTSSATAGTTSIALFRTGGTATASAVIRIDSVLVQTGTNANSYGDGNTLGWIWNGIPNSSTSTGSAM